MSADFFAQPDGEWKTIVCDGKSLEHIGILQDFTNAVNNQTELFVEGSEGSKSLMLANAMYLSSWKKQMVKLEQKKDTKFINWNILKKMKLLK